MKRRHADTLRVLSYYAEGALGRTEMLRNLNAVGISEEHLADAVAALDARQEWLAAAIWLVVGAAFVAVEALVIRGLLTWF